MGWTSDRLRMEIRAGQGRGSEWEKAGLDADQFLLARAGDPGAAGGGEHVDFAAHAELGLEAGREVDAGFDGEAGAGQDQALVVSFEVVEICAGAVEFGGDVVAGAVGEVFAEAGAADD